MVFFGVPFFFLKERYGLVLIGGSMMKRLSLLLVVAFLALSVFAGRASACVGKSLVVGSVNTPSLTVAAEMMGILITERTGTTVVIKYFDNFSALNDAMKKGEVDIMVD